MEIVSAHDDESIIEARGGCSGSLVNLAKKGNVSNSRRNRIGAGLIGPDACGGHAPRNGHYGGNKVMVRVEGIQDPIDGICTARFEIDPAAEVDLIAGLNRKCRRRHGSGRRGRYLNVVVCPSER